MSKAHLTEHQIIAAIKSVETQPNSYAASFCQISYH